ncbi:MAG: response regulator [Fusobacterium periodonticum]|uniref:hybrid sensor histidine kinase/response regulator n=1 Tax=Fusobacterium pseudoperiodonticum TaxID=2663009 RepID=UPI000C1C6BC2|nr:response regulator [Fusobacterium pseudoperiodonticum]ATV67972.1 hybrid sensor histidine kinase/response regulator [Fusobacterium pseudoperiodonticum]MBF1200923.1 response regulator [Fusobacterium periodonticum]
MQTHKKISIINTFLLFVFFSIFIYFFNIKISSSNILKIFLLIFTYYLLSNFFTKFFLLNTYKTIQKLDKILSVIHGKFINELEDNFISLQECFNEVFSTIKLDILDILVKEEEIKKEKEKAEILSTELKELNKNLEDKVRERTKELSISKEIAESANKAKNEFLAKISHEMRTPLTPIIGYSRILAKDIDEPSYKEKLEIIHTSGVKLLNFTNELLDFSKIESGKVDLNYEPFNVRALFQDIYHEHIDLAKAKGIDFKIDYLHANVSIYSDKIKIYEIAKNIIHNALKYTNKGFVLCDVFVEKNTLYFNVYDSGVGILEENISNIFESFVQIGKEQSGAGLGLSITKKLLKVLNGTIEVESKVGQGSTFKIQIPIETSQKEFENFSDVVNKILNSNNSGIKTIFLKSILKLPLRIKDLKDAHKKQDIEEVRKINHLIKGTYGNLNLSLVYDISEKISLELKKENISFDSILHYIEELEYLTHTLDYNELFNTYLQFKERKIRILIAEDAEETRDFLKVLLETPLIEVTCVENGLEALNILKTEKFDLVFLDISMPVMDGVQAVTTIKSNDNFKDLPVVALTAHAIIGYKEKYLNCGFDAYITKPINDSVLFSCLEKFILSEKR